MKLKKTFITTIILLFFCILISLSVGRYNIPLNKIIDLIKVKIFNRNIDSSFSNAYIAFWVIRVPRTIMVIIVGAILGISGTVFQGIFRNPLVSPGILGISSAASFGAGIAIIVFGASVVLIQFFAFGFALIAIISALYIGLKDRNNSITSLVLAGIVISSLFSAGTSVLKYIADPYTELPAIQFWLMGAFNRTTWSDVIHILPVFLVCITVIYLLRWYIDILCLNEEEAKSLGVNVKKMRLIFITFSTFMTASSISYCGIISWISLIIPHIARFLVGAEHKKLIPYSGILGALFTLIMDTIARTITAGEIPISILTSCFGAPFLAYLLIKYNKKKRIA